MNTIDLEKTNEYHAHIAIVKTHLFIIYYSNGPINSYNNIYILFVAIQDSYKTEILHTAFYTCFDSEFNSKLKIKPLLIVYTLILELTELN